MTLDISKDITKSSITNYNPIFKGVGNIFIDEYIIVPDFMSSISKILFLDLFPIVENWDTSGSRITVNGKVRYNITYATEEHFNAVKVLTGTLNYSGQMDSNFEKQDGMHMEVKALIQKSEIALLNQKKVSVNIVLKMEQGFFKIDECEYVTGLKESSGCEIKTGEHDAIEFKELKEEEFKVNGLFEISFDKEEIESIAAMNILNYDYKCNSKDGVLELEMVLKARVAYVSSGGSLQFEEFEFSATEGIRAEFYDDSKIIVNMKVRDVQGEIAEDNDGERRIIKTEVKLGIVVEVYEDKKVNYLKDLYFTDFESKVIEGKMETINDIKNANKRFSVKSFIDKNEECEDIFILSVDSDYNSKLIVDDEEMSNEERKIEVSGILRFKGLMVFEEGFKAVYMEMPFNENVNLECKEMLKVGDIRVDLNIEDVFVNVSGGNKGELEADITIKVKYFERKEIVFVEEINVVEEIAKSNDDYTRVRLYYAGNNESLWELCKKNKVKIEDVVNMNDDVNFDNLIQGTMLMLP